jgi:hypothetical protein
MRAAMIRLCFVSRDRKTLVWAFCVFVRPIVEYASPVWSPYLIKDIDHVESVQRHFTKYLPGLKNKSYCERLKILNIESLELRRLKLDLNLAYMLLHGLTSIDYRCFFSVRGNEKTRGHPLKLTVKVTRLNCCKYFFSNRIVAVWNGLPSEVVMASSLQSFKQKLRSVDLTAHVRYF